MSRRPQPTRKLSAAKDPPSTRHVVRGRPAIARRIHIEALILWPVFGAVSALYVGFFARVLGIW